MLDLRSPMPNRDRTAFLILVLLAVVRAVFCAVAAYARHLSFSALWPVDIANVNQAIWNTAHGRPYFCSVYSVALRDHFDPALMLLSPPYLVSDSIFWVFLLYSLVISSGALAVFLISRHVFENLLLPILLSVYYLLFFPLFRLNVLQVKGDALAIPLLLFALYAYQRGRFRPFVLWSVLGVMCKEAVALAMVAWGCLALAQRKGRRWVVFLLVAGVLVLVFTSFIYHPFIQGFPYKHAKAPSSGVSLGALLSLDAWVFLGQWVVPNAASAGLLAPSWLVPALPLMLAVFFWDDFLQNPIRIHCVATVYPFVFAAMVLGVRRIGRILVRLRLPSFLLPLALVAGIAANVTESWPLYRLPEPSAEDKAVWELIELIPPEASVAAPPLVLVPLSTRPLVHSLIIKDARRGQDIDLFSVAYILLSTDRVPVSKLVEPRGIERQKKHYFRTVHAVRTHTAFRLVERRSHWELYERTRQ